MIERKYIAFDLRKYESEEAMWKDISTMTKILIKQDYEVLIKYEDCDVYILEYAYNDSITGYGADRYKLVTQEEEEKIDFERTQSKSKEGEDEEEL